MTRYFYSLLTLAVLTGSAAAADKRPQASAIVNANPNVNASANANANVKPPPPRRGPWCYPGSVDTNTVPARTGATPTVASPTILP